MKSPRWDDRPRVSSSPAQAPKDGQGEVEKTEPSKGRQTFLRWIKFNTVGAIGIGVQLAALAILRSRLKLNYLLATGIAVEIAVLHNFVWHERFTWADRPAALAPHPLLSQTGKIQCRQRSGFNRRKLIADAPARGQIQAQLCSIKLCCDRGLLVA